MSRNIRIISTLFFIVLFGTTCFQMLNSPLWGWWPLALQLSAWGAILSVFYHRYSKHAQNVKLLLASSIAGLLLSAAFPPSPLTPLIFVAWVPLLWAESIIYQDGKIQKWKVWKYAFHTFYLWNVITTFWVVNTAFVPGLIANILNAIIMATVFMFYHVVKSYVSRGWRPFVLISFWLTFEFIHMYWDINWPWLTLGNTFAQYPSWIQWYEYTGVFGGGLWILGVNWLLYQFVSQKQKQERWLAFLKENIFSKKGYVLMASVFAPILVSIVILFTQPDNNSEGVEVAIVQPNFEPHYQKFEISPNIQLKRFLRLSDSIVTPETKYLVYPETSFGMVLVNNLEDDKKIIPLQDFVNQHQDLHLVTGASSYRLFSATDILPSTVRRQGDQYWDLQNSALQISSENIDMYFKSILVPGAEFFPFKKFLPFIKPIIDQLGGSQAGHTKQKERTVFKSAFGNVAPVICYESIYGSHVGGHVKNGADMIFIITNDGWWDNTPGHIQHLLFARLRAIEHRRPIARSANTGTSAFITPTGKIYDATNYEETTAIRRVIYPRKDITFYTKWGDIIARISIIMTLLIVTFSIAQAWKNSVGKTRSRDIENSRDRDLP